MGGQDEMDMSWGHTKRRRGSHINWGLEARHEVEGRGRWGTPRNKAIESSGFVAEEYQQHLGG